MPLYGSMKRVTGVSGGVPGAVVGAGPFRAFETPCVLKSARPGSERGVWRCHPSAAVPIQASLVRGMIAGRVTY